MTWGSLFRLTPRTVSPIRLFQSGSRLTYDEVFRAATNTPIEFWESKAEDIKWFKKWDKVVDDIQKPDAKWFVNGTMNTSYNCVDRHIDEGFGDETAIIFDSPVSGQIKELSYNVLKDKVAKFAGVLSQECGVKKGDRVLIYMPMLPETIIAMLACARIGAIHCVIFGGFSPKQLATRLNSAEPRVILTASYGVEGGKLIDYKQSIDKAMQICQPADYVAKSIVYNRPQFTKMHLNGIHMDWAEAMDRVTQPHDAVPLDANDPLYVLYTSGTTGNPKGIVRSNGGHAVALKYAIQTAYGMNPGDRWWASSELGWVVGHSFICYAPLFNRNATVMYEGKPIYTPDAGQFFRILSQHGINGMLSSPSAIRSIRGVDPDLKQSEQYRANGLDAFRHLYVAGEHCDAETLAWIEKALPGHVTISDSWWQTETGWPITAACTGLDSSAHWVKTGGCVCSPGSAGLPVPGFNVEVKQADMGDHVQQFDDGQQILVKRPLPPGTAASFWGDHDKFLKLYFKSFPGYYDTMDVGKIDEKGCVHVMARADDVINVSGHRLSTAALEEAAYHEHMIQECAIIPIPHDVKGAVPFGVFVTKSNCPYDERQLVEKAKQSIRKIIGPVAAFQGGCVVPALPKTKSGKTCRGTLADMAAGKATKIPSTIENARVFRAIFEAYKRAGLKPSLPN